MKNILSYIFYTVLLTVSIPFLPLIALADIVTGGAIGKRSYGHPVVS
jgi:hypothetical protein